MDLRLHLDTRLLPSMDDFSAVFRKPFFADRYFSPLLRQWCHNHTYHISPLEDATHLKKPFFNCCFHHNKRARNTLGSYKGSPVDSTASFGQRPPKPCLCFLLYSVFFAASSDLFEAVSVRPSRILGAARDEGYYSEVSKL